MFRTVKPSGHTRTHVELLRSFLGSDIQVRQAGERAWLVEVPAPLTPAVVFEAGTSASRRSAGARSRPRPLDEITAITAVAEDGGGAYLRDGGDPMPCTPFARARDAEPPLLDPEPGGRRAR